MLYDFDNEILATNLTPPVKRLPKYLGWLFALTKPIQTIWVNIFQSFKTGSLAPDFDILNTYNFGDEVVWTDKCVYQATYLSAASFSGVYPNDADYWTKTNEVFIGMDERIKYNSQRLLFEYALNRFFKTTGIYIQNNFVAPSNVFVMGNEGKYSSYMPLDSQYQTDYLAQTPTYVTNQYDYTIFFPLSDYNSLGSDADGIIRSFADKYNMAGMIYDIQTF